MSHHSPSDIRFDVIYLDTEVEHEALTQRILQRCQGIPVIRLTAEHGSLPIPPPIPSESHPVREFGSSDPFADAKRRLHLTRHRGAFMKKCPGSNNLVCCNYYVVNFSSNCPMDCHFCFLQDYLNNPTFTIYVNTGDLLKELKDKVGAFPERQYRIGTGEITDSLVLDDLTGFSQLLVPWFARQPQALLELKTKSACVESLLDLDPAGRTVVSWSLSPREMIEEHEEGTAPLEARLAAAVRCQQAGYRLGFHFDPIIHYPMWQQGYRQVIRALHEHIDPSAIEWISLGSLRYTPGLKRAVRSRFPASSLLDGEMFPGADGKFRYLKQLRLELYRFIVSELRGKWPNVHLYLCMESAEVWKKSIGWQPNCAGQQEAETNGVKRFELIQKY